MKKFTSSIITPNVKKYDTLHLKIFLYNYSFDSWSFLAYLLKICFCYIWMTRSHQTLNLLQYNLPMRCGKQLIKCKHFYIYILYFKLKFQRTSFVNKQLSAPSCIPDLTNLQTTLWFKSYSPRAYAIMLIVIFYLLLYSFGYFFQ